MLFSDGVSQQLVARSLCKGHFSELQAHMAEELSPRPSNCFRPLQMQTMHKGFEQWQVQLSRSKQKIVVRWGILYLKKVFPLSQESSAWLDLPFALRGTMGSSHPSGQSAKSLSSPLPFPLICKVLSVGFQLCRVQNLKILPQKALCVKSCMFPKGAVSSEKLLALKCPRLLREINTHKCHFSFFPPPPAFYCLWRRPWKQKEGQLRWDKRIKIR